jgi:hypothetical protein
MVEVAMELTDPRGGLGCQGRVRFRLNRFLEC